MRSALALLLLTGHAAMADCLIRGIVVDAANGKPLAGARVMARSGSRANILRIADSQGGFCFDRLTESEYSLLATHAGYLDAIYGGRPGAFEGRTIKVGGPAVTLKMTRSASISGTVTDAGGEWIEHAFVILWRKTWDSDQHHWNGGQITGVPTDDRGAFRFPRLAPGNYYLSAEERSDPGGLDEQGRPVPASGPPTYYAGTFAFERATVIPLATGEDTGVSLTLLSRAIRHFTARLAPGLTSGPTPELTGESSERSGPRHEFSARFAADGTVEVKNLAPGKYSLETSDVKPRVFAEVDLTDHDVEDLVLAPEPVYEVHVTVIGDPRDFNQRVMAREQARGDFHPLNHLAPGVYWLELTGKEGYLKNLMVDGRPAAELDLRGGPPASVEVTYSSHLARLEGRVEHAADRLAATVVYVDEDHSRLEAIGDSAKVDAAGKFQIDKLRPGKYRLFAIEGFDEDLWGSPELAAALRDQSVALELGEDDRKQVALPLITVDDWEKALRKIGM